MIIPNFLSDRDPNSAFDGSPGVPNIIDKQIKCLEIRRYKVLKIRVGKGFNEAI